MFQKNKFKVIGDYAYNTRYCKGEGSFGKVYQGYCVKDSTPVAIKKIDINFIQHNQFIKQSVFNEINILKQLSHPNIVNFFQALTSKNSIYVIMQLCDTDLKQIIKQKKFKQQQAFSVISDIITGYIKLIQANIIHRDLKPANILIRDSIFKIGDFGMAKYVTSFQISQMKTCVGSPIYMAPQILQKQKYSSKCDIWSLGIIFYEMVFGLSPWSGTNEKNLISNIKNRQIIMQKGLLTEKGETFLKRVLVYNQEKRADWNQLIALVLQKQIKLLHNDQQQLLIKIFNELAFRHYTATQLHQLTHSPFVYCLCKATLNKANTLLSFLKMKQDQRQFWLQEQIEDYKQLFNEMENDESYERVKMSDEKKLIEMGLQLLSDESGQRIHLLVHECFQVMKNVQSSKYM